MLLRDSAAGLASAATGRPSRRAAAANPVGGQARVKVAAHLADQARPGIDHGRIKLHRPRPGADVAQQRLAAR